MGLSCTDQGEQLGVESMERRWHSWKLEGTWVIDIASEPAKPRATPWLPWFAAAAAKSLQSCPTLCSPPGSPDPGILQARTLEWDAISFSLGLWHKKLSFLLSYSFGSFLFLEAKDIPSVTGRVTPDNYLHPFYLVSKACNLQRTRTTFLPAL